MPWTLRIVSWLLSVADLELLWLTSSSAGSFNAQQSQSTLSWFQNCSAPIFTVSQWSTGASLSPSHDMPCFILRDATMRCFGTCRAHSLLPCMASHGCVTRPIKFRLESVSTYTVYDLSQLPHVEMLVAHGMWLRCRLGTSLLIPLLLIVHCGYFNCRPSTHSYPIFVPIILVKHRGH